MTRLTTLLCLCFFTISAIGQSQEDKEIILRNIEQFSKDLVAGDIEAVANAYTEDAKIFPGNQKILSGLKEIRAYWTPPETRKSRTTHHKILPEEIEIVGETAYDWGYYEGETTKENGEMIPWKGKYVIVWKKVDSGVWKIYLDIWNRVSND